MSAAAAARTPHHDLSYEVHRIMKKLDSAESTADLLLLRFDGKGIAMRHENLRAGTRRAAVALHTLRADGVEDKRPGPVGKRVRT